jgi:L-aspartate oxidase
VTKSFDVLVIGSGIAGLSFALDVARRGHAVAILTKKTKADSSTNWAQGGLAAVTAETDDFKAHVRDTLAAGAGLCDPRVVRAIVGAGPECVRELAEWGVRFSRDASGGYDLGREGGHGKRRILHVKDMTGRAIEEALLKALAREPRIAVFEHCFAIDVIRRRRRRGAAGDRVLGAYALDVRDGRVHTFRAPVLMLATGGAGQVYLYTTNPDIATGDGIAMAWRAGCRGAEHGVHPVSPDRPVFRDRPALPHQRGRARRGRRPAQRRRRGLHARLPPMADLAPRDIVARAIDTEMKKPARPMSGWTSPTATRLSCARASRKSSRPAASSASTSPGTWCRWCPPPITSAGASRPPSAAETALPGPLRLRRGRLHRAPRGQPAGQQLSP